MSERFSGQNLADCPFCPPGGRQFRTARLCSGCGQPLCLSCRPDIPGVPSRCPDCGGGGAEEALREPGRALERLAAAGLNPPLWLTLLRDRAGTAETPIPE